MRLAKDRRLSRKRIVLLIATGLMLVFIFGQSAFPKTVSAEESGLLVENVLNPLFELLGFRPLSQNVVRKIAHVAEFAILSVLLALCFRGQIIKSAGTGFAAAFLDESIQLLSERGALITDVWIDLIGVAIGSVLGLLIVRLRLRSSKRRQKRA
ncbi:MAG: VanZ family protein [Clostridia bacterium]|nr:VanZ family protein [Clostridia bacterium]